MNNNLETNYESKNTQAKKPEERRPYQAPQLIVIDLYDEREVLATHCKSNPGIPTCISAPSKS